MEFLMAATEPRLRFRRMSGWTAAPGSRRSLFHMCLAVFAVGITALATATANRSAPLSAARHADGPRQRLSSLPLTAQSVVSATLGSNNSVYMVRPSPGGFQAHNPAQRVSVRFRSSGLQISAGDTRVHVDLTAVGYGKAIAPVTAVAPTASANRVTYAHGGLSEWYANGPLGVEQGFTIPRAPSGHPFGPLTLSLALSGDAQASLAAGRRIITFRHIADTTLRYTGLRATDARGRTLPASLALHDGRLLITVDARGARYPLRIDPFIQQGEKLTATAETEGHESRFGFSVALSSDGNTALIGNQAFVGGGAWVFTRSAGVWRQQGPELTGSEQIGSADFGSSVALSADGNTALIGGDTDNSAVGAAWVFTRSGGVWTQQGPKLTGGEEIGEGLEFGGGLGTDVALSSDGNTALIGGDRDNRGNGAAWVFTRTGSTWVQQGPKLAVASARFGVGVALSSDGNTALIGSDGDNEFVGAAWVFTRSGGIWTQRGPKLTGSDEIGAGVFGLRVALSSNGNTALIGAPYDNPRSGGYGVGAAWVFQRSGSTWTQQGPKLTGGGESGAGAFGYEVALASDGNTALIGGYHDNPGLSDNGRGAAWVFTRSGPTWAQQGSKFQGSDETGEASFGISVALSSDASTALIGGAGDDGGVGATWVFVNPNVSHPTATTVSCSPATVAATRPTTCTATVTDTAQTRATAPTGTVSFASSGKGSFIGEPKCELNSPSGASNSCSVTYNPGATPENPERSDTITDAYGGDGPHEGSKGTTAVAVVSPTALAHGSFVIGNNNATVGGSVTFYQAEHWRKLNSLSGGSAPASFEGFAESSPSPPTCGEKWTSKPGTSSAPPAVVPEYMEVVVATKITKSGSTISGNAPEVVVVKTTPGYARSRGDGGSGRVVAIVCKSSVTLP